MEYQIDKGEKGSFRLEGSFSEAEVQEAWKKAIAACVKEKLLAVNLKAFEMGYNY